MYLVLFAVFALAALVAADREDRAAADLDRDAAADLARERAAFLEVIKNL